MDSVRCAPDSTRESAMISCRHSVPVFLFWSLPGARALQRQALAQGRTICLPSILMLVAPGLFSVYTPQMPSSRQNMHSLLWTFENNLNCHVVESVGKVEQGNPVKDRVSTHDSPDIAQPRLCYSTVVRRATTASLVCISRRYV